MSENTRFRPPSFQPLTVELLTSSRTRRYRVRLKIPDDGAPLYVESAPRIFKELAEEMKKLEQDGWTPEEET